jgi:hypothetical protein
MATHGAQQVQVCMDKFTALEKSMSTAQVTLDRIVPDLYGRNSKIGLMESVTTFHALYKQREDQRDKDDAARKDRIEDEDRKRKEKNDNRKRWFQWSVTTILALIAIFAATFVGLKANDQIQHHLLTLPHIFTPRTTAPATKGELHVATAIQPQDATTAPPYQPGVTYVY